jgi:hypothetical protein
MSVGYIIQGIGETVLLPISIPCSVYRTRKCNKLIKKWYSRQSNDTKRLCDEYFDGIMSYQSMNAKVKSEMFGVIRRIIEDDSIVRMFEDNKVDFELDPDIQKKLIPSCILQRNRYIWNILPNEDDFFKLMNYMVNSLKLIREGYYNSNPNLNSDLSFESDSNLDSDPNSNFNQLINKNRLKELLIAYTKTCSICDADDDRLNLNNSVVTSCSHIFHTDCLNSWYKYKKSKMCPICRKQQ